MGLFTFLNKKEKMILIVVAVVLATANIVNLALSAARADESARTPAVKLGVELINKFPRFGMLFCGTNRFGLPYSIGATTCETYNTKTDAQTPVYANADFCKTPLVNTTYKAHEMTCSKLVDKDFVLSELESGKDLVFPRFIWNTQTNNVIYFFDAESPIQPDVNDNTGKTLGSVTYVEPGKAYDVILEANKKILLNGSVVYNFNPRLRQISTMPSGQIGVNFNGALQNYQVTVLTEYIAYSTGDVISSLSAILSLSLSVFGFFFPVVSMAEDVRMFKFGKKPTVLEVNEALGIQDSDGQSSRAKSSAVAAANEDHEMEETSKESAKKDDDQEDEPEDVSEIEEEDSKV